MNPDPELLKEAWQHRKEHPQSIYDRSGVWRFRDLLHFYPDNKDLSQILVSMDGEEGRTKPFMLSKVAEYVGLKSNNFYLQFEGDNPTGSFKDNGMAAGFTHAKMVNANKVACASTGNTSSSMAAFAANEGDINAYVFMGSGRISIGKLAQTLEYGANAIQILGDFDDAMKTVQAVSKEMGIYLLNSLNAYRLEGQKTIIYRLLEGLKWEVPDLVVCPGGNLGNTSAFGKALTEPYKWGFIDKLPRIVVVNANGANTLDRIYNEEKIRWSYTDDLWNDKIKEFYTKLDEENFKAHTIASAIEIGKPINLPKALRALYETKGMVVSVSDQEILDAKAIVGRNGFGCEPASAASVAGIKKLTEEGIIDKDTFAVGILTGHQLKDPKATIEYHKSSANKFANPPIEVPNDIDKILEALRK